MKDKVDWLLHIDTDELMYPGGNSGFSLQKVLKEFADDVDTVVFPNYASLPESDKLQDQFTEVCSDASAGCQFEAQDWTCLSLQADLQASFLALSCTQLQLPQRPLHPGIPYPNPYAQSLAWWQRQPL